MEDITNFNSIVIDDANYQTKYTKKFIRRKPFEPIDLKKIYAFIPGTILNVFVSKGQEVKKGEKLMILEAMKMKNLIVSPLDGKIKLINTVSGQKVNKTQILLELE